MRNYIFISPNFPKTYYMFVKELKNQGFNVLGIADCNYEELDEELRNSLTDYYKVYNMNDYEQMYKAVAYFAFKYGPIEFIESNNEYWLETDAKLRSDFNVKTGKNASNIEMFKCKSVEKKYYQKAGVKTARYLIPTSYAQAKRFINKVGYPVVVKPDNGVGAYDTFKIKNDDQLKGFFDNFPDVRYIMEEFVEGDLISFDGVCNSKGDVVFASNEVFPNTIMDVVNEQTEVYYYCNLGIPEDLYDAGQRTLHAFGAQYRYFHLEFFRLTKSKEGLGEKGDIIGLETNMRSPGGYTPDMINYAHSVNTYKIFAEVMATDTTTEDLNKEQYYCVYASRRKGVIYKKSSNEVVNTYKDVLVSHEIMPDVLAGAMGNEFFVIKTNNYEQLVKFKDDVMKRA